MRAIFISYRRDDAEGQAGRLFEDLEERFGKASVFMDVTGIEPGRDFRKVIEQQVASCGVLLAIIGKDWLNATDADGRRRLDDPADFVRLETAAALRRDIPVIPVLVRGAKMPRAEQLPEVLADLSFRNSVELSHARWASDVQLLINALLPYVDVSAGWPGGHADASGTTADSAGASPTGSSEASGSETGRRETGGDSTGGQETNGSPAAADAAGGGGTDGGATDGRAAGQSPAAAETAGTRVVGTSAAQPGRREESAADLARGRDDSNRSWWWAAGGTAAVVVAGLGYVAGNRSDSDKEPNSDAPSASSSSATASAAADFIAAMPSGPPAQRSAPSPSAPVGIPSAAPEAPAPIPPAALSPSAAASPSAGLVVPSATTLAGPAPAAASASADRTGLPAGSRSSERPSAERPPERVARAASVSRPDAPEPTRERAPEAATTRRSATEATAPDRTPPGTRTTAADRYSRGQTAPERSTRTPDERSSTTPDATTRPVPIPTPTPASPSTTTASVRPAPSPYATSRSTPTEPSPTAPYPTSRTAPSEPSSTPPPSSTARIDPPRSTVAVALLGDPAPPETATRTIAILPGTRYVNVTGGEVVRFTVGDKSFAWNFSGRPSSFDLSVVAPPGVLDRKVMAYVAPNPLYRMPR